MSWMMHYARTTPQLTQSPVHHSGVSIIFFLEFKGKALGLASQRPKHSHSIQMGYILYIKHIRRENSKTDLVPL